MDTSMEEENERENELSGGATAAPGPLPELELIQASNAKEVARITAERIAEEARKAVAERGTFTLAVSGGKSHWLMLAMLSSVADMPWEQTELFQVDERIASPGSPDRHLTHLILTLPIEKQASLRPMPVTRRNLEEAAAEYEADLPRRFDVVHLDLGPDGEAASLGTGDPALTEGERRVAVTKPAGQEHRCMTLTLAAINSARSIFWLVTGEERRDALRRLLEGDRSIPAGLVRREACCVVADASARGASAQTFAADLWRGPPSP